MSELDKILQMIETVSPNDDITLDEIDARIDCYMNDLVFSHVEDHWGYHIKPKNKNEGTLYALVSKYSRSKDALKRLRPKNWDLQIESFDMSYARAVSTGWIASCINLDKHQNFSYTNKTEELAELHVILRAIEANNGQ